MSTPSAVLHQLDERVMGLMARYATQRFERRWLLTAAEGFYGAPQFNFEPTDMELIMALALHHWEWDGHPIRELFLAERGARLAKEERVWLLAQRPVVITIWEVLDVEKGVGMRMKDLLGGEERFIHALGASRQLRPRDAVLGRVVEYDELAVFSGMYPMPLPPVEADAVVRVVRRGLELRGDAPVSQRQLANVGTSLGLIRQWRDEVNFLIQQVEQAEQGPLVQRTMDGEPILFVEDRYELVPEARPRVLAALAKLEGLAVAEVEEDEDGVHFTLLKKGEAEHPEWQNTVIGRAHVEGEGVRLETNSLKRADALRLQVEAACDGLLTGHAREESDPSKVSGPVLGEPPLPTEPPTPETLSALRDFKVRHYATWVDTGLPALRGKSPREAVRTRSGRHEVDVLLKHLENVEAHAPSEARMDFSGIRRELGLEG